MKKLLASIPNRFKAIYLLWAFIHFVLLLIGRLFDYNPYFYPFDKVYKGYTQGFGGGPIYNLEITFNYKVYDYSEFLIYTLTPIVVYLVLKLWHKKDV